MNEKLASEQMKLQMENFKKSADAIVDLWFHLSQNEQDKMSDGYPFGDDFADVAERIHIWMENFKK